jgi:hypothetical protein
MRNDLDLAGRWPDTPMKLDGLRQPGVRSEHFIVI